MSRTELARPLNPLRVLLTQRWHAVSARYALLKTRERLLVMMAMLAAATGLWDVALNQPLGRALALQQSTLTEQQGALRRETELQVKLADSAAKDPSIALLSEGDVLAESVQTLDAALQAETRGMVPPEQMHQLLRDVLASQPGMKVLTVETLAPIPLLDVPAAAAAAGEVMPVDVREQAATNLYRHGLHVELQGSYLASLSYLRALESLPWSLVWDRVEYQVDTHPQGRLNIWVHTLAAEPTWMGL